MIDIREHEGLIRDVIRHLFGGVANAHKIAKTRGMDVEDLMQIGNIAMWRASKTFDSEKGEWSTYAYQWIKGAILNELNGGFPMTMPKDMSLKEKVKNGRVESLYRESDGDTEGFCLLDSLPSKEGSFADELLLKRDFEVKAEGVLSKREKDVLYKILYLDLSHEQIASQLGCTKRTVRTIFKSIKSKLPRDSLVG